MCEIAMDKNAHDLYMKNYKLFQEHSQNYIEMAFTADRRKRIDNPDGYGKRTGQCGDTVEIFLLVAEDCIHNILFEIDGCINTIACANTVARLAEGKTIKNAWDLTSDDIINYLGTLPAEQTHCAELAVGAFYKALSNYQKLKCSPLKKIYGKM